MLNHSCPICAGPHPRYDCPKRPRSGKRKAPRPTRPIISFDCETVPGAGIVLFLASGTDRRAEYLYDAGGVSLERVLDWLVRMGQGARCFGFYFDYDVQQIVRLLPLPHLGQLAARDRVTWREYTIRHTPGKRFSVTRKSTGQSITVWDVSGWAQCSFVSLCKKWELGTEAERAEVEAMKAKRGDFGGETEAALVSYTTLECALLSEWVGTILQLHEDCGIQLKAFSGPGSTASAMISARGWKPPELPARVMELADRAFFGGRSEISCVGPVAGPIHSYDVNSAYPFAISQLPELRDARWRVARAYDRFAWGFWHVRWSQPKTAAWGLFPLRGAMLPDGKRSVSLLYPREGQGWFHSIEVEAAMECAPEAVEVISGFVMDPRGKPFQWIEDEAARRLEYKASGDQRAYPLKVGLNSVYGKLAQHSGTHPLQCLAYASAVTAHTRGLLLRLAVKHQHNVILTATDGILSTVPLDVPIGAGLGQWEYQELPDAWMLQAGVYWAGSKKRTRGIDARGLDRGDVERLWKRRHTAARLNLPARRVLSYRLCAAQRKLEQTGTWHESTRCVRFDPRPRRAPWKWDGERLLTIPAKTSAYLLNAAFDQIIIDGTRGGNIEETEALPKWERPE